MFCLKKINRKRLGSEEAESQRKLFCEENDNTKKVIIMLRK